MTSLDPTAIGWRKGLPPDKPRIIQSLIFKTGFAISFLGNDVMLTVKLFKKFEFNEQERRSSFVGDVPDQGKSTNALLAVTFGGIC